MMLGVIMMVVMKVGVGLFAPGSAHTGPSGFVRDSFGISIGAACFFLLHDAKLIHPVAAVVR